MGFDGEHSGIRRGTAERSNLKETRETEEETGMSNTVKIKNKKKKNEVKINYKLWAIIFGIFVAVIVAGSVWASFHWGVGVGTIGKKPMSNEDAAAAATEIAAAASTDAIVLTPEQLEEMGYNLQGADAQAEGEENPEVEEPAAEEAGADDAAEEKDAGSN